MSKLRAPLVHRLHDYFFPHRRNDYRPHFFSLASITVFILAVIVFEAVFLVQTKIVFLKTNFLASVLPGALVALTNHDRAAKGLAGVTENSLLDQAAQAAASDMANKGYFSHISPGGTTPWQWLNLVGYEYSYAGQNLAMNFTDSQSVEMAWVNSPTHRANIEKSQYTEIGIGTANGIYKGKETTFVVEFFASPAAASAPTLASSVEVKPPQKTSVNSVQVLGAQTQIIATSPHLAITCVLSVLAVIISLLLIIAIIVKVRVQYVKVIAGGLLLLVVIIGLLLFNSANAPRVQLSYNASTASVW